MIPLSTQNCEIIRKVIPVGYNSELKGNDPLAAEYHSDSEGTTLETKKLFAVPLRFMRNM